jgi:hypothetical protein
MDVTGEAGPDENPPSFDIACSAVLRFQSYICAYLNRQNHDGQYQQKY